MGQSVLSELLTQYAERGYTLNLTLLSGAKGHRVNIPELVCGDTTHFSVNRGNAIDPGDGGKSPGKSSLFFVRCINPGMLL